MRNFIRQHIGELYALLISTLMILAFVFAWNRSYEQAIFSFVYGAVLLFLN